MAAAALDRSSELIGLAEFLDQTTYKILLRRAASILCRETAAYLFEPADLVHEAFLRIARSVVPVQLRSAAHLVALATIVMRRIMIDHSRSVSPLDCQRSVPIESGNLAAASESTTLVMRDALSRLAEYEERLFRIVEMRVFGGFDVEEIASALDISSRTVKRGWGAARDRLQDMLGA